MATVEISQADQDFGRAFVAYSQQGADPSVLVALYSALVSDNARDRLAADSFIRQHLGGHLPGLDDDDAKATRQAVQDAKALVARLGLKPAPRAIADKFTPRDAEMSAALDRNFGRTPVLTNLDALKADNGNAKSGRYGAHETSKAVTQSITNRAGNQAGAMEPINLSTLDPSEYSTRGVRRFTLDLSTGKYAADSDYDV